MNLDLVFFLATAAGILGQFTDARTTEVGLQHGLVEANALMAKLIKKVGISPIYALKCAVLPATGALALGLGHEHAAIVMEAGFAAAGFALGVLNYLKLRKAGVKISEIF